MEQLFRYDEAKAPEETSASPHAAPRSASLRLEHAASCSAGLLKAPFSCCVLPNGKVCISDAANIVAVSAEGKKIKQPPKVPAFSQPCGLACDGTAFFVIDAGTHQLHRLNLRDFSAACAPVGGPGSGPSELLSPRGLVVYRQTLFVADSNNHRILRYHCALLEPTAEPFGGEGGGEGQLRFPHGLAILEQPGARAELVVADQQNHRLQCFDPASGAFVRTIGGYGQGPGCFDEPTDVAAVSATRQLLVAERVRVQLIAAADGAPQQIIVPPILPGAVGGGSAGRQLGGLCLGARPPSGGNTPWRAYVCDRGAALCHVYELKPPAGVQLADLAEALDEAMPEPPPPPPPPPPPQPPQPSLAAPPPPRLPTTPSPAAAAASVTSGLTSPDVLSCLFDALQLQAFLPVASVCKLWAEEARAKAAELACLRFERSLGGAEVLSYPTHVARLGPGSGGAGSGPGSPPMGRLLVAESATSALRILSADGEAQALVGSKGRGPTELHEPRGLLIDDQPGSGSGSGSGTGSGTGTGGGTGGLPPGAVAGRASAGAGLDEGRGCGALYVSDARNRRIQMFRLAPVRDGASPRLELLGSTQAATDVPMAEEDDADAGRLGRPDGLALLASGGRRVLCVSDKDAHCVRCYDAATLQPLGAVARKGSGDDELCEPGGMALLEADQGDDGGGGSANSSVGAGGEAGVGAGAARCRRPEELVVCDVANHRLVCFAVQPGDPPDAASAAGGGAPLIFHRVIGRLGYAPGSFAEPSSVACAPPTRRGGSTRLVVAERRRVQVLSRDGVPLQVIVPPSGCGSLYGCCLWGRTLVVADVQARRLHEFSLLENK